MKGSSPYRKLVEIGIGPEDATNTHRLDEEEQSEVESLPSEDASVIVADRSANDGWPIKYDNHSEIIASPIKKRKRRARKYGIKERKRGVKKFGDDGMESLTCDECGKTFPSLKSKYGHMRCHSGKLQNRMVNKEPAQSSSPVNYASPEQMSSWSVTEKRCHNLGSSVADIIAARTLVHISRDNSGFFDKDDYEVQNENSSGLEADRDGTTDTNSQSPVNSKRMNERDLAVMLKPDTTSQDKRYGCLTCNKSFATHQALGGHTASHNKRKSIVDATLLEESSGADRAHAEKSTVEHKCQTCGLSFPSGQALGGHKRKHWTGLNNSIVAPSTPASPSEVAETTIHKRVDFDLNESLAHDDE